MIPENMTEEELKKNVEFCKFNLMTGVVDAFHAFKEEFHDFYKASIKEYEQELIFDDSMMKKIVEKKSLESSDDKVRQKASGMYWELQYKAMHLANPEELFHEKYGFSINELSIAYRILLDIEKRNELTYDQLISLAKKLSTNDIQIEDIISYLKGNI